MSGKVSKAQLQQAVERAIQAFQELEAALDTGDNYKIGRAQANLRHALNEIKQIVMR